MFPFNYGDDYGFGYGYGYGHRRRHGHRHRHGHGIVNNLIVNVRDYYDNSGCYIPRP